MSRIYGVWYLMTMNGVDHSQLRLTSPARGLRQAGLTCEEVIAPSPRVAPAGGQIGRSIREALMNEEPADRLPASIVGLLARMRRADRALRNELGRAPSFEEVAAALGLTASQKALATWALKTRRARRR